MGKTSTTAVKPTPPKRGIKIPGPPAGERPPCNVQQLTEAAIRIRAYHKWEAAGKPPGDGINFWLDAERELLQLR